MYTINPIYFFILNLVYMTKCYYQFPINCDAFSKSIIPTSKSIIPFGYMPGILMLFCSKLIVYNCKKQCIITPH